MARPGDTTHPLSFRLNVRVTDIVRTITIAALAALFGVAGIDKILNFNGFHLAVRNYVLLPLAFAPYVTFLVPVLELWVAVGLVIPAVRSYAAVAAATLLGVFAIGLTANYLAGVPSGCGCLMSITLSEATLPHILFNGLIAGLSLTLFLDRQAPARPGVA